MPKCKCGEEATNKLLGLDRCDDCVDQVALYLMTGERHYKLVCLNCASFHWALAEDQKYCPKCLKSMLGKRRQYYG